MLSILVALTMTLQTAGLDDRGKLFAWFDSLGFTNLYRTEFVKVTEWDEGDDGKRDRVLVYHGFKLLRPGENAGEALPFLIDARPDTERPSHDHQSVTKADFVKWAVAELEFQRKLGPLDDPPDGQHEVWGQDRQAVVCRVADLLGHDDLSKRWYEVLRKGNGRTWQVNGEMRDLSP